MPISEKTLLSIEEAMPSNAAETPPPQRLTIFQRVLFSMITMYFGFFGAAVKAVLDTSLGLITVQSFKALYASYPAVELSSWDLDLHRALSYIKITVIGELMHFITIFTLVILLASILAVYYRYLQRDARQRVQGQQEKREKVRETIQSFFKLLPAPALQVYGWVMLLCLVPIGIATIRWSMDQAEWDAAASRGELQVGGYGEYEWLGWGVYGVSVVDGVIVLFVGAVVKMAMRGFYGWVRPQVVKVEDKETGGT
ncbi:hypothetical protein BXZ70DRAFT_1004044 [Cristinia sonorae]|uniref:Uncharacterized protein n=1 Tax=Cristinia sonorae TaxID=1940300 RepID=A0A8K0V0I2_9AGAR|nr:hypothetical protein BXZ70DRAFT_1004044 [Cristinia sonorae]